MNENISENMSKFNKLYNMIMEDVHRGCRYRKVKRSLWGCGSAGTESALYKGKDSCGYDQYDFIDSHPEMEEEYDRYFKWNEVWDDDNKEWVKAKDESEKPEGFDEWLKKTYSIANGKTIP